MWPRRRPSQHICLAARDIGTVEHLGAIADQGRQAGLDVCWINLDDQPGIGTAIRTWADPMAVPTLTSSQRSLERHFKANRPAAVWVQTPYPEHYPQWFWDTAAGRVSYAGYGLTLSTWEQGLYGLDMYRTARWLITESEAVRAGYVRFGADPERVCLVGNPLLYMLREALVTSAPPSTELLWAPHWTEDWFGRPGFSTWRETAPVIRDFAVANPESRIRLRPHPLLPAAIENAAADDTGAQVYRELAALPNVTVSSRRLVEDILDSAALVTDGVSIIAYWAATGRPMAITRDETVPPFNAAGERFVELSDRTTSASQLRDWLETPASRGDGTKRRAFSEEVHPTGPDSPVARWALRAVQT